MIKLRYLFLAIISVAILYSCGDSNTDAVVDNFDHEAQAIIDNDSLVSFFKKHYYDTSSETVKKLETGQTSLFDDANLKTQEVTDSEVDYKLYYYLNDVGMDPDLKGNPTVVDSVLTKYSGRQLVGTDSITNQFDANTGIWFTLDRVIRGWTYGFTNFKGGQNASTSGNQLLYNDGGKGILFIPSGLAYRNTGNTLGNSLIPGNRNLMFYIELWDVVVDTDIDSDNIPSIDEDIDEDGDPRNDDTDEDRIPNYFDNDDDNDGKATKDEDRNGDGDPRNDFNDPNNPTLPDYLNPNIFG